MRRQTEWSHKALDTAQWTGRDIPRPEPRLWSAITVSPRRFSWYCNQWFSLWSALLQSLRGKKTNRESEATMTAQVSTGHEPRYKPQPQSTLCTKASSSTRSPSHMHDTSKDMQHEFKDRDEMWFVSAWVNMWTSDCRLARLSSDRIFMINCTVGIFNITHYIWFLFWVIQKRIDEADQYMLTCFNVKKESFIFSHTDCAAA